MKTLCILHSTVMGGATISFLNLAEGLIRKGVEIVVVIPCADETFIKELKRIGAKYIVTTIAFSAYSETDVSRKTWKIYYSKMVSLFKLIRIIRKEKPDVIHSNTGVVHEGYLCGKIFHIPHVWHLREYQDLDFGLKIIPSKKDFIKKLKKSNVIAITKDILSHFQLIESPKHKVIYNGIMHEKQVSLIPTKDNFFLCSSRISPEKGHEDVIRCFAKFHEERPDYKLIILGFGEEEYCSYLQKVCEELKCTESVIFEGFKKDVTSYMCRAKALIVGSLNEGFGRMTAEAAFCGCLVIGRNTGGTKEIIDEIGGLSFNSNEVLFQHMNFVATMEKEAYMSIVSAAQQKAVELYSIEQNIANIYSFYQSIISK